MHPAMLRRFCCGICLGGQPPVNRTGWNFFMRRPRAPNPCPARKPSGSWCEASPGRDCRRVYEICCPGRFAFSDVNHLAPRRHAAPSAKPAIPDAPGFARGLFPELILTLLSPLCSCRMARAPAWRPFLADGCLLRLCRAAWRSSGAAGSAAAGILAGPSQILRKSASLQSSRQ